MARVLSCGFYAFKKHRQMLWFINKRPFFSFIFWGVCSFGLTCLLGVVRVVFWSGFCFVGCA